MNGKNAYIELADKLGIPNSERFIGILDAIFTPEEADICRELIAPATCQDCVERCKFDAIEMRPSTGSKKLKAYISAEKCKGCGLCIIKCKQNAIRYEIVRPPEYLKPPPPPDSRQPGQPVHVIPVWGHYDLK